MAEVLGLIRVEFAYMDGVIDPPSSMHQLTLELLAAGPGEVWATGMPVVACAVLTSKPGALYIGKLAVAQAARGRGMARAMIALAERRALEMGLDRLELQTRVELVANQATFAAMGFTETGRTAHPGFDRPTTITYRRALG